MIFLKTFEYVVALLCPSLDSCPNKNGMDESLENSPALLFLLNYLTSTLFVFFVLSPYVGDQQGLRGDNFPYCSSPPHLLLLPLSELYQKLSPSFTLFLPCANVRIVIIEAIRRCHCNFHLTNPLRALHVVRPTLSPVTVVHRYRLIIET